MQLDCKKRRPPGLRGLLALVLAACVLVAQAGLARHDLGHAFESLASGGNGGIHFHGHGISRAHDESPPGSESRPHGSIPDEDGGDACPLHGLFAQAGAFAPAVGAALAPAAQHPPSIPPIATTLRAGTPVPFHSRAPPPIPA